MREAHPIERAVGIEYYVSDADGIGGRLRERPEDFRVREIERFECEPLDADSGGYPHLVLRVTLRAWDTNDFAARLSNALGISRERVSWAGTKDKHAVTTQLFTVRAVDPDAIPTIRDADVEVLGRAGRDLAFGDLAGNAFRIRVREPDHPGNVGAITDDLRTFAGVRASDDADDDATDDAAADATDDATTVGVPNYFGQQRFGSRRPVTHEVGLHVVRREWREAVLTYVGNPHDAEPETTREARAFVDRLAECDDPDWGAALDRMPERLGYERSMLHRLHELDADGRGGSDDQKAWREALETVPSNLQRLFVNAAQSYAFNLILSERLRRGLPFDRPVAGDVVCFADTTVDADANLFVPDTDRRQRVTADRVETITRHCERGRAFVTAPLVGTDTWLGDGEPGEIERAVLEDLDLAPADFDLPGEFDSSGTRRAILVRTDLSIDREPLAFDFALPKGSYATVLLREYLKTGPLDL